MTGFLGSHTGSWGLPDFGITEKIGGLLGQSTNYQGGSDWAPNTAMEPSRTASSGSSSNIAFNTPQLWSAPGYIQGKPANNILGAATSQSQPSGGGGGTGYPGSAQTGMTEDQWIRDQDYRRQQEEAARQTYGAENQRLNTAYDQTAAQLQNQLGTLGTQRDQSFAQVDLGLGDVQRQVGNSKTNLQTNTEGQIKQAGSIARSVQGANRNQLRALGILNSSAAGQILSKPMNQFSEQRAQLGQFLVQKTAELDDFVNQKVKEATTTKDSIVANYNNLVNQIQTDLRFNQRQRNDALQSASAVLNQRLAEISQAVMSYQQQAELQKQQFAISLAQAMNYQNPQFNRQALEETRVVTPTQGTQTASFYTNPDEYLRKTLGGLPSR